MSDQAEIAVDDDIQARMAALLEAEETQSEPEDEPVEQEVENAEDTEAEQSDEEPAEEEPVFEITHNGETQQKTLSELKSLAQQGFDYTQKTQTVADERRAVQAERQALQTQLAIQSKLGDQVAEIKSLDNQIAQYKQIDWAQLAEVDPTQYLKLNHAYRDLKEARDAKVQDYNQQAGQLTAAQEQARNEMLQAETRLLHQKVPEFAGDKAGEAKSALAQFLASEGFSPDEIGSIMDHRMVSVAWKAAQYDKLKAAKPQVNKRVADVPKVVKNKPAPNVQNKQRQDLRAKLKATGDGNIAAKLIESML